MAYYYLLRGIISNVINFHLLKKNNFTYYFGCTGSSLLQGLFSSCSERGFSPAVVCRLLNAVAPLVAEHRL